MLAVGLSPKRSAHSISRRSGRLSLKSAILNSFYAQPVIQFDKHIRISVLDEDGQLMCNAMGIAAAAR